MKKKICLACVAVLMVLSLAACGEKKGNGFAEATPTPGTSSSVKSGKDLYHVCGGEVILASYDQLTTVGDGPSGITDEELEEEFQSQIASALADYPNYIRDESRDGTVIAEGDTVNIDYVGRLDGVAFDGGSDTEFDLTIGSKTFIEDFENGLIGKTVGTTVDVDTKFPDDYQNADLAGKTTTFTITINYVGQKKDEADDDYIRRLSKGTYESMDAYRTALKEMMEEEQKSNYENDVYDTVIGEMVKLSEFPKVLDEDVAFYEEDMIGYYSTYASYYGMSVEEFVTAVGYETYDAFLSECHDNAVEYVKEYMVLQEVAKKENITVSEEKFDELLAGYMESAQQTDKDAFIEEYSREYLEYCMKNDLALEFLVEKAKAN